jgi:hypothetical protein
MAPSSPRAIFAAWNGCDRAASKRCRASAWIRPTSLTPPHLVAKSPLKMAGTILGLHAIGRLRGDGLTLT